MPDSIEDSRKPGGPHHLLARLEGNWAGTARTWFEPGKLADESPIRGTIRPVLGGRFVLHDYESSIGGEPLRGIAIHGYDLNKGRFVTAWADTFHVGTDIMLSHGEPGSSGANAACSVLGHYDGGGEQWGWRTQIDVIDDDHITITHFNITPTGEEAKAVEIVYERATS